KVFRSVLALIFVATFSLTGHAADNVVPSIETVLQQVIAHARQESDNDRLFEQLYGYSSEKMTEFRNGDGDLKKRENKTIVHQPNPAAFTSQTTPAKPAAGAAKTEGVSDTHSNVHGQQFKRNDFLLNEDMISRFRFQLVGQEMIDGRQAFIVEF